MALNPDYNIRPAQPSDEELVPAMARLCADGRIRAYGIKPGGPDYALGVERQLSDGGLVELRDQIKRAVAPEAQTAFWVAENRPERRLAGICIAQVVRDEGPQYVYLDRVFVGESDEGNGIASDFLERVIVWAGSMRIEGDVVSTNERALGLYTRRGFVIAGKEPPIPGFETELTRLRIVREAEGDKR